MSNRSFLNDILRRVSRQALPKRNIIESAEVDLSTLCNHLLDNQSEASGLIMARQILDRFRELTEDQTTEFFQHIASDLGPDDDAINQAIAGWTAGSQDAARRLHFATEPRSQELIRILNRVPGATEHLVAMRAALLTRLKDHPELAGLDLDFQHLFASWFNRGFLEIRRIDWSTSAAILEKIIEYEAVHEISGWDDLRRRVGDTDRRLFAFFHPAMPAEPLIFVEVALTVAVPDAIAPILSENRKRCEPEAAVTAVFYSISNCQAGLRGISFGNFLIKQVVTELQRELPDLSTFVTLSPVPGLRRWIDEAIENNDPLLDDRARLMLNSLSDQEVPSEAFCKFATAVYLTQAKRPNGSAYDPVAHFHLGNGAELYGIHANADLSARGIDNSWGVMVNYLYASDRIDLNHQTYSAHQKVAASAQVLGLVAGRKGQNDV